MSESLKHKYQLQLEYTTVRLAQAADALASDMSALADKLRMRPNSPTVNELGEVQSRGMEVDRLCATRQLLMEFIETIEAEDES